MPTPGGFNLPPLRGYVPGGELDPQYDLMRVGMALEVPFWEGCDVPYCRSRVLVGEGLQAIRGIPTPGIGGEFSWNLGPLAFQAGAPKSGHVAVSLYVNNDQVNGGPGWRWEGAIDAVLSQFVIGRNYSTLLVGTPMLFMNPDLPALNRSDTYRNLWLYQNGPDETIQRVELNYRRETLNWHHFAFNSIASPVIPIYGRRVAMLFVNGDEAGATPSPRVFIAGEDGSCERADFSTPGTYSMGTAQHLELFQNSRGKLWEAQCGGGCWEYYAHFVRSFEDDEARAVCRDALGAVKWDPYVVRRVGWRRRIAQLLAQASAYGRVGAKPAGFRRVRSEPGSYARVSATPRGTGPRVTSEPSNYPRISATGRGSGARVSGAPTSYSRVSGSARGTGARVTAGPRSYTRVSATPRGTGPRVAAAPTTYQRITARVRIADQEADMQATPLCPSEMNWMADNVLELSEVLDDMQEPPAEITSANLVTVEIWDRDTDTELTDISPVTLTQVGATNVWRESVLVNEANGFADKQRLVLVFIFDGGAGLQGRFVALAVVASATS